MSDEEDDHSAETEAELALKKRREAQAPSTAKGLDASEKELLQSNKKEREKMDDEINELRKRNEKRKKAREEEEKRLAAERAAEDERRKTVEEDKKRKKEEEDEKKKKDRASKMAEFEKWKNPSTPNFVISAGKKVSAGEEDEAPEGIIKKSKEQQDAEKKAILSQRIVALHIDGFDTSKLTEKAKELHKLIYRLESEKFDYEKRFKAQQVDMMELAERARQANKVGRGGLKRAQVSSEDVDEVQSKYSGAPAKILMYSKYERQKDKRAYGDRKTLYTGPQWGSPADRIKPQKTVKWSEEGLPTYEVLPEDAAKAE